MLLISCFYYHFHPAQLAGPNYFPNSFQNHAPSPAYAWHNDAIQCDTVEGRYEHYEPCNGAKAAVTGGAESNTEADPDYDFSQCRAFYQKVLQTYEERARLALNIATSLVHAQEFIQARALQNFEAVDPEYALLVKTAIATLQTTCDKQGAPA